MKHYMRNVRNIHIYDSQSIFLTDSGTELNISQDSNTELQEGRYSIYSIIVMLIYKLYNVYFIQTHNLIIHVVN